MSLSNNSTLEQSIEIVDPEGSCKKDNYEAVFSIDEIEIIELGMYDGWSDYNLKQLGENSCAYYLPDSDKWIISKINFPKGNPPYGDDQ